MRKPMTIHPDIYRAITTTAIQPWVKALQIMRSMVNDDGVLLYNPAHSQYEPVDKAEDAKSVLQAVDELLATVNK